MSKRWSTKSAGSVTCISASEKLEGFVWTRLTDVAAGGKWIVVPLNRKPWLPLAKLKERFAHGQTPPLVGLASMRLDA